MNQELWKSVWEISERARALPPEERRAFLDSICTDPDVATEVWALITADEEGEPSGPPGTGLVPALIVEPGSRVGRYTVQQLLGRGATGDTYRAHDEDLNRPVALKILRTWPDDGSGSHALGIREARAASALNHPNIVTVFEVLQLSAGAAIAMEFVDGRTLRHWCHQPQPSDEVFRIGRQTALALAAAHGAGIVHRDIKPENIIVRNDGYVKLVDFGLAQPASSISTGRGAGTLRYMSPEQARGSKVGAASDVFSLGIVLFEMATGSHPFHTSSHLDTLIAIASAKPLESVQLLPTELRELIGRMLSKSPADRPTATEVAQALISPASAAATPPKRTSRRMLVAVCAVIALGAVALAVWNWITPSGLPRIEQFTHFTEEDHVTSASISPDGKRIIFINVDGEVRLRDLDGPGERVITQLSNTYPDQMFWIGETGKLLLSSLDLSRDSYAGRISIIDSETGQHTILPISGKRAKPSFDGRRIVYLSTDRSETWISSITGAEPRRVAVDRPGATGWVEWSTDGKRIHLFSAKRALGQVHGWEGMYWRTLDADTGSLIGEQPTTDIFPGFMQATGRLLMVRRGPGLVETEFDSRGHFAYPPRQIANEALTGWLTASADGKRIAGLHYTWNQMLIYHADTIQGSAQIANRRRFSAEAAYLQVPHAWTPDDTGLIFEAQRVYGVRSQIFVQELNSKLPRHLAPSSEDQLLPSISTDGKWVLFLGGNSAETAKLRLKRVPLAGGPVELVPGIEPGSECACLYGAKRCVLRRMQGEQAVFYEFDPVHGKERELTRVAVSQSAFGDWSLSPDGTKVVFTDATRIPAVVRVVHLDEAPSEKAIPIEGPAPMGKPVWTAAGDGWYIPNQDYQLRLIGLDGSNRYVYDVGHSAIPSSNGRKLAFVDNERDQNIWLLRR